MDKAQKLRLLVGWHLIIVIDVIDLSLEEAFEKEDEEHGGGDGDAGAQDDHGSQIPRRLGGWDNGPDKQIERGGCEGDVHDKEKKQAEHDADG
jgi:hypothetical protein